MSNIAVFGSTGLIGSNLLKCLEYDNYFSKVNVITRKPIHFKNSKFKNIVIDFNDINSIQNSLKNCQIVFVSIGTTQSKVNWNLKKYKKIDYEIPINIARAAKKLNIKKYLIVVYEKMKELIIVTKTKKFSSIFEKVNSFKFKKVAPAIAGTDR